MSLSSISPSATFAPPPSVRSRPTTFRHHVSQPQITTPTPSRRRTCELFDLHDRLVPYKDAWDWQRRIVKDKKALVEDKRDCPDTLIVLQHRPVYTMGTGSSEEFLNFDPKDAPLDVYRTERGGEVTYHGPGQTIGNWAAVGIRVSQWIAYHGLALNVTADLTPFRWIVPCGIRNREVGSIKSLLKEGWTCGEFGSTPISHADHADLELIDYTYNFLIKEFMEVFRLEIYQNQFGQAFEGANC